MRVVAWASAFFVLVVFVTAGAVYAAHRPTTATGLTAARQPAGPFFAPDRGELQVDPPHVIPPPTLPPTAAPVAPSSGGTAPVRARPPAIVVGSGQQALINQDRASRGLGPLTWNGCLYNVAVANARRIAAQGSLSHTNGPQVDLTCGLGNHAGENIGYTSSGINDPQLNTAFMNSPEHYANIMGPYHYVATAWVVAANGWAYIAVEFG